MTSLLYLQQYGDRFEVRVNTVQAVNAWRGRIILPEDFRVGEITYGSGIGDIWQTPPAKSGPMDSGNFIDFVGGSVAPFSGDGLLFGFTAVPPVRPEQLIRFDLTRTKLYGGDGGGRSVEAKMQPLTVNPEDLLLATSSPLALDGSPPEPFQISVLRDEEVFGGQPAIIFRTTDKGSGIDHYEVEERFEHGVIGWHRAESPYLIGPGTEAISVRAIDRAGNYRFESIAIDKGYPPAMWVVLAGIMCAIGILAVYFIKRRRR